MESEQLSAMRLSAIVLGELEFGAEKAPMATATGRELIGIDYDTTRLCARIRASFDVRGTPIGASPAFLFTEY
ncbi:hypothetical protein ACFFNA_35165 [Mesorhizobium kowhaii]|uniref:hypothetical protein n=1 Tax=Mesorhizobium kowhaii TaxID=1300272 RepID=UPI0035EF316C